MADYDEDNEITSDINDTMILIVRKNNGWKDIKKKGMLMGILIVLKV
jgi:hypothetical protein